MAEIDYIEKNAQDLADYYNPVHGERVKSEIDDRLPEDGTVELPPSMMDRIIEADLGYPEGVMDTQRAIRLQSRMVNNKKKPSDPDYPEYRPQVDPYKVYSKLQANGLSGYSIVIRPWSAASPMWLIPNEATWKKMMDLLDQNTPVDTAARELGLATYTE